jgi:polyisoprenyl-phosphate glycosyltransferase
MNISVIVPVFNGESTIAQLSREIKEILSPRWSYEIIFVYDNGTDNSWEVLRKIYGNDPGHIRIFRLSRNFGQHNALLFGMGKAKGEMIITIDEDLQHDPGYLAAMINKMEEGKYDLVYGKFIVTSHSFIRRVSSFLFRKLLNIAIHGLGYYSSFRIISRRTALDVLGLSSAYPFIDGDLSKVTTNIYFLEIDHRKNQSRQSGYNLSRLMAHSFKILLSYTSLSRWIMGFSFILLIFSLLAGQADLLKATWLRMLFIVSGVLFLIVGLYGELFNYLNLKSNHEQAFSVEEYG